MRTVAALVLFSVFLVSCAQESFQALQPDGPQKKAEPIDSQCVPDATDYNMQVNVISFGMTSDTNVEFGFNYDLGWFKGVDLGVHIKRGSLDLQMELARPLKPKTVAKVIGKGVLTDSQFDFKIDASIIDLGVTTGGFGGRSSQG